jgi:H+-translocating NAD(P) transhydrogenase subunit alpha
MRIAVLSETDPVETRVAATPDMVKKYKNLGADVVVQAGAGGQASISDAEFEAVGATIAQNAGDAVKDADIVLKVRRPADGELNGLKKGALVIGIMDPYGQDAGLKALADAGASAFAMELMPRITRAQVMDDRLTAALMPFRNRDAAFALATFLGPVLVDAQPAPNRVPD